MTHPDLTGGLEMLEIVSGVVFGRCEDAPEPPRGLQGARQALESAITPHLASTPCAVAFSGGRDSAVVLAGATYAARRLGASDPVPVTMRFPEDASTDETAFQESVVGHLGLSEWIVIEPSEPLDVLSPMATYLTLRHGLLYPGNIHFLVPVLREIRGGSLLTGVGGDEVLDGHEYYALAAMLTGKRFPTREAARGLARRYLTPGRARDELRSEISRSLPWLLPDVRAAVADRIIAYQVGTPLFADSYLTSLVNRVTYLRRANIDLRTVGSDFGVSVANPLLDPAFIGAVADGVGKTGFRTRTEMMHYFFGDLLPDDVVERTTKAVFDEVLWTPRTSETAAELPVDTLTDYVDADCLKQVWASDALKGNTILLAKYLKARSLATPEGHEALDTGNDSV
jgi:hypothetical protein